MATATFNVQGISCEGCVNAIKRALASLTGVLHVDVSIDNKQVNVTYDDNYISYDEIKNRIADAGYEAASV